MSAPGPPMRGPKGILRGALARMCDLVLRRSADRNMDEELRFHIDMETEKNIRQGLDPGEARRRALLAFGGVERHRQRLREGRSLPVLEPLWLDLRFALRSLARTPGFAVLAALTIAVGVGATTTVFSTLHALLLRPLALPGVERLVSIDESRRGSVYIGAEGTLIPYDRYRAYRGATEGVFRSLAAHRRKSGMALRLPDVTIAVNGTVTSGNYFETLGVPMAIGRPYASENAAEVVISHELWTSRFGRAVDVLGTPVGVDGRSVTIVGVAPEGFAGASILASELWAPVEVLGEDGEGARVVPLGRLHDDVPLDRAEAAVEAVARSVPLTDDATLQDLRLERPAAFRGEFREMVRSFLAMLLGMALMVLLIASANVAGVMLARGHARGRETAVRLALGAGRTRLVRHLLAESLMVFAAGGALGVLLAHVGTRWVARMDLPSLVPTLLLDLSPDGRVLAFAVALTGLTGVAFGLAPAFGASRPDLVPSLKTGSAGAVGGDGRARTLFVGGQVALAVTLLLAAALFARSLQMGLRAELGFEPQGVVAATVDLGPPLDYDEESGRAFHRTLLERVRALPGVERAGLSRYVLASGSSSGGNVWRTDAPDGLEVNASYTLVSPGYFETMRIELVSGRAFTAADDDDAPPVVVINQTLADPLFPGQSPIGHRIEGFTIGPAEIVGVTTSGRYAYVTEDPRPFVFVPFGQAYRPSVAVHARAPGAEAATLRGIADELRALDPDVALGQAGPVEELIGFGLFPQRFAAQLIGAFGLVGLLLAGLGIYGVLAYQVARRTREFGVRRALGAPRRRLVADVVRRGAFIAAAGCGLGIAVGAAFAQLVRGFLFGIQPVDPVTFTAVPVVLFGVAILASLVPALKASSVEASHALRTE